MQEINILGLFLVYLINVQIDDLYQKNRMKVKIEVIFVAYENKDSFRFWKVQHNMYWLLAPTYLQVNMPNFLPY